MKHRRRETDRRHPVYLITRVNYSDISQRWWNLTRPGVPKLQRMQHHQRAPVRYFVKSDQIPSRTGAKLSFKGIMYMADEAEMWLILLIPWDLGTEKLVSYRPPLTKFPMLSVAR
jgi:hypothetical protein